MYRRHHCRRIIQTSVDAFFKFANDSFCQSLLAKWPLMVHLFWGHGLSNINYQTLQTYQKHETRA